MLLILILIYATFWLLSGSSAGLSLVLNVEQYEYMKGPQDDAGIKVGHEFKPQPG